MPLDPKFHEYAIDQLKMVAPIRSRKMFGGVGIWSDDFFFALIADKRLFLKVNDTNRPDFEKAGMTSFSYGDPPHMINYWQVPDDVLDNPDELAVWVEKAVAVARTKKQKKR